MSNVYGIGHSVHPIERLGELLMKHKIEHLIDVRSAPRSRWPQYNQGYLKAFLGGINVGYTHSAKLGGKPPMAEPVLRATFQEIGLLLTSQRACLMCSEGSHLECHRHYLLSPVLNALGYDYYQITTAGELVRDIGPDEKTLKRMAKFLPATHSVRQPELF